MPRRPREDEAGAWHHVMNRGIARRTVFETDRDIRMFLSFLARLVRNGKLQIHAFCVLPTHFHLLIRSPVGELSAAMQWAMNRYVRWFNRGRHRDGPLMRGRFVSKRVTSEEYCRHLVRYIDFNPVQARIVGVPAEYPHGSAWRHARGRGAPWLERAWIQSEIRGALPGRTVDAAAYAEVFGEPLSAAQMRWLEHRLSAKERGKDPLDELVDATPEQVRDWMRRKAALADGTEIGQRVCEPWSVVESVDERRSRAGAWRVPPGRGSSCAWELLRVGLLRHLCASTFDEIAELTAGSRNSAWRRAQRHDELLASDERYSTVAAALAFRALQACHRAGRRGSGPRNVEGNALAPYVYADRP